MSWEPLKDQETYNSWSSVQNKPGRSKGISWKVPLHQEEQHSKTDGLFHSGSWQLSPKYREISYTLICLVIYLMCPCCNNLRRKGWKAPLFYPRPWPRFGHGAVSKHTERFTIGDLQIVFIFYVSCEVDGISILNPQKFSISWALKRFSWKCNYN